MCPMKWQSKYLLHEKMAPTGTRSLLVTLKLLKHHLALDKPKENPKSNPAQGKNDRKCMTSFHDRILKKPKTTPRPKKHCDLCTKHGGMHKTHDMSKCNKYQPDGTPKKLIMHSNKKHDSGK